MYEAARREERQQADAVLIYDGECNICIRSVEWIRRQDPGGAIELLAFQDPRLPIRFPELPIQRCREAMQLLTPDGKRREGAEAVEELLRILPGFRWLAWGFRVPGVRRLARAVYRYVARRRRVLGCADHCGLSG
jgi:predicted DCC family thiol-disulfide oxidoreductase YuxK